MNARLKERKPTAYRGTPRFINRKDILGSIISHYRLKAGLAQYQLADKIGCTQVTCSRMEIGIKDIDRLLNSERLISFEEVVDIPTGTIKRVFDLIPLSILPAKRFSRLDLLKEISSRIEDGTKCSPSGLHHAWKVHNDILSLYTNNREKR